MSGFFQDDNGNFSIMRVVFAVLIAHSIAASWYVLVSLQDYAGAIAIFSALSGVAITLKLGQKPMERKK